MGFSTGINSWFSLRKQIAPVHAVFSEMKLLHRFPWISSSPSSKMWSFSQHPLSGPTPSRYHNDIHPQKRQKSKFNVVIPISALTLRVRERCIAFHDYLAVNVLGLAQVRTEIVSVASATHIEEHLTILVSSRASAGVF